MSALRAAILEARKDSRAFWSFSFDAKAAEQRARRAYRRNLADPGDCKGDEKLLAALAVAEAEIGKRAGWIPEVQKMACSLADKL
jgi:hypothetical protein